MTEKLSQFAGMMPKMEPELWNFRQYNISENLSPLRVQYHEKIVTDDGEKIVEQSRDFLVGQMSMPGKTLVLHVDENHFGEIILTVIEQINAPERLNQVMVLEFGEPVPIGQFSLVGTVRGKETLRYVFLVSNLKMVVDNGAANDNDKAVGEVVGHHEPEVDV